MAGNRRGRKPGPPRIKVNAVVLENGRQKHLFSVITQASKGDVMRIMQALRGDAAQGKHPIPMREISDWLNNFRGNYGRD